MKRIILILTAAILVCSLAVPTKAQTTEAEFDYLETSRDIVIWVSWPTEKPDIIFKAPNGTKYDPLVETSKTVTITGENDLYYTIYNAPAGQWYVSYDKKSNESIDISMQFYNEGLSISGFTLGEVSGNSLPVTFSVSHSGDKQFNYKISAVIEKNGEEKELSSGTAKANREISVDVPLSSLATYSGYMLKLYVWYVDSGTDYFDLAYSDSFSYTNSTVTASMIDFSVTIDPENVLLNISWPNLDRTAESVLVAVFEDGAEEPAVYDEYSPEYKEVQLSYDPSATKLAISLSIKLNGIYQATLTKAVNLADFGIDIEDASAVSSTQLPMKYSGFTGQTVYVEVNDDSTELFLNGDGSVAINLNNEWNDVQVYFTDDNNVKWLIERSVFVDRIPPTLNMSEAYDGITTASTSIDIIGVVNDYSHLTINDADILPDFNGSFSYTASLSKGENKITIIASDMLGNETQYAAVITCTAGGFSNSASKGLTDEGRYTDYGYDLLSHLLDSPNYIVLIAASFLCIIVIVFALLFWRKKEGGV